MSRRRSKCWFIDARNRTITEKLCSGNLNAIYKLIGNGCTEFRNWQINGQGDCLYYDAEALLRAQTDTSLRDMQFLHKRIAYTFIGNGFIMGTDSDGNALDVHIDLETAKREITFWPKI